jgi:hypothetical protein
MNAMMKPFRALEPHEVFDTVVSARAARFDARQPIPPLPAGRPRTNRSVATLAAQIFIVDVRSGLAEFAKTLLDHAGFATCAFNDYTVAGHAFAFAPAAPWLLMIHDLMANSFGMDLVRACRFINPQLRVMVVRDVPVSFADHNPIPGDVVLDQPYHAPVLVQEVRRLWALVGNADEKMLMLV